MDSKDYLEHEPIKNSICSLEWIAWAMEAARRYKDVEPAGTPPETRPDAGRHPTDLV